MNRRRCVYVGVGILALILLSTLAPFVIWGLIILGMRFVPEGSDAVYDGMRVRMSGNQVFKIYLGSDLAVPDDRLVYGNKGTGGLDPIPENFFVRVNGQAKQLKDVQPRDLEAEGFQRDSTSPSYIKGAPSPVFSLATFNQDKLESLILAHGEVAELGFSTSPRGPFLTLPASFSEFEKQFGKPNRWERWYRDRHDPR